jgi:predicted DNA-binding transcriptional regulator AlpA
MGERLLRRPAVLAKIPICKTALEERYIKTGKLKKIQLGPRSVAFAESNVDEIVAEIIAKSSTVLAIMPTPNLRLREGSARKSKIDAAWNKQTKRRQTK